MALIRALFDKSIPGLAEAFGGRDVASDEMQTAIKSWIAEYFRRTPDKESDPCQRLPYTIVHKLEKGMFAEYDSDLQDKESAKGSWMRENLIQLDLAKSTAMQWTLIAGESWLKPIPFQKGGRTFFRPQVIRRNQAVVMGRDPDGRLTSIGTIEQTAQGGSWYTLVESRTVDADGFLQMHNKLYRSSGAHSLGAPCALDSLSRYAELAESWAYPKPVGSVGLVPLRTPMANCVDGSMEAVSIYEPAMGLICNINRNEALLSREFELGQHRIVAPAEMLRTGDHGERKLDDQVFVGLQEFRAQGIGLTAFSPTLRHESYEARKQSYLKSIENVIGMKRGLLSDVQEVEKTAYEIASTAGDYNLSLIDLQRVWFDAVREYLTLCDTLGRMYHYCDDTSWDVREQLSISWGNGVLYDPDKNWSDILQMVQSEMLKPEIALAWKYDLPWETPQDLEAIREKYMPELADMLREAGVRSS